MNQTLTYRRCEVLSHGPDTCTFFALKYFEWKPNGDHDLDALRVLVSSPQYRFVYPCLDGNENPSAKSHGPYLSRYITVDKFSRVDSAKVVSALRDWVDRWITDPPRLRNETAHNHIDALNRLIDTATSRFELEELGDEAEVPLDQFLQPWYEVVLVNRNEGTVILLVAHAD